MGDTSSRGAAVSSALRGSFVTKSRRVKPGKRLLLKQKTRPTSSVHFISRKTDPPPLAPPHPHTDKIFFPVCYTPPFTLHRPLLTLFNYLSQMFHPITFHLPIIFSFFSAIISPLSFLLSPPPRRQLNCDMNSKMVPPPTDFLSL